MSADRTTKGINICNITMGPNQLMLIDTEGIGSIELNLDISNEKKRDNKIILGSLVTSRVFLFNILRDASK